MNYLPNAGTYLREEGGDRMRLIQSMMVAGGVLLLATASVPALAQVEEDGTDPAPQTVANGFHDPAAAFAAFATLRKTGLLLVPDSGNNRVMAFDPLTGNLIDPDFIPADPDHLVTPIEAILNRDETGILVSDQFLNVVQEFDLKGDYVRLFAPAGGDNENILRNPRGLEYRPNGDLLVTVGAGANANAVAAFDPSGVFLGNFIANGAGGLLSPFDVLRRTDDYLVSGINDDVIHSYNLAGKPLPDFAGIDTFPEQIAVAANFNVLVANFEGSETGVVEYTRTGALVGVYAPPMLNSYRGVYELPNGNILTSTMDGVFEISRGGVLVDTKISGVSARYITLIRLTPLSTVPLLSPWGLGTAVLLLVVIGAAFLLRRGAQARTHLH